MNLKRTLLDKYLMGQDLFDVKKEVVLNFHFNKSGKNMFGKQAVDFSAQTTINRSDFGIDKYTPGLGDKVTLKIDSEANLQNNEGDAK